LRTVPRSARHARLLEGLACFGSVAHDALAFDDCCRAGRIDVWQPLPGLSRGGIPFLVWIIPRSRVNVRKVGRMCELCAKRCRKWLHQRGLKMSCKVDGLSPTVRTVSGGPASGEKSHEGINSSVFRPTSVAGWRFPNTWSGSRAGKRANRLRALRAPRT